MVDTTTTTGYSNNIASTHVEQDQQPQHSSTSRKDQEEVCYEEVNCQLSQTLCNPSGQEQQAENYTENIFAVWEKSQPEFISNKSSKKLYKLAAKQAGITCTMSNECRCMECQSNYFDCEFDDVSILRPL